MNTIHDLRDTLAEHAEIHDVEIGARSSAIARRVRVVRRRRVAGVGAAAVLALVAAGLTLGHSDRPPAPVARVLGVVVPTTLTSTGYTFDHPATTAAPEGSTLATVTVDPTDAPVLVSWATQGADQRVRVTTPSGTFHSSRPDFGDFVRIDPGAGRTTVSVRGSSRTALAVYRLASTPPDGVTTDGISYRRDVADRRLVGARIAPEGATTLSLTVTMPGPGRQRLVLADLCSVTGSGRHGDAWLEGEIDGRPAWGAGCSASPTFDPGAGSRLGPFRTAYRAGQRVRITVRLLDHHGGQPLVDPHARLGIGAYVIAQPAIPEPHGLSLPRTIEAGGHTWALEARVPTTLRQGQSWRLPFPGAPGRLMMVLAGNPVGPGTTTVFGQVDGHDLDGFGFSHATGPASEQLGPLDGSMRTVGARVEGTAAYVAMGLYGLSD
ncbi:hypothetical protein GCM10028801_04460 [Nocardioides maradonensis]